MKTDQDNLERPDFARYNGLKVTLLKEGYARVDMDVRPEHLNPINSIHGGAIFTLADSASGSAVYSLGNLRSTSIDANIHYLRPGMGRSHVYAEATVIKRGRKVVVTEVSVKDQDGEELAVGIFSNMVLDSAKAKESGWSDFLTNIPVEK